MAKYEIREQHHVDGTVNFAAWKRNSKGIDSYVNGTTSDTDIECEHKLHLWVAAQTESKVVKTVEI